MCGGKRRAYPRGRKAASGIRHRASGERFPLSDTHKQTPPQFFPDARCLMPDARTDMATTDCKNYREELKAYADGELSPLRRVRLRAHLDGCPDCREELAFMERMAADFRAVEAAADAKLSPE